MWTLLFQDRHLPIRQKTRAIWRTKLNSVRPEISLVPFAVCKVFDFNCENNNARLGSSKWGSPISVIGWLSTFAMSCNGVCSKSQLVYGRGRRVLDAPLVSGQQGHDGAITRRPSLQATYFPPWMLLETIGKDYSDSNLSWLYPFSYYPSLSIWRQTLLFDCWCRGLPLFLYGQY